MKILTVIMDSNNLFNVISLVLAAISLVAIVLSYFSYKKSSQTAMKVSSKEHDISENLKYEVLKVISTIRALDTKATVGMSEKNGSDYSKEIEALIQLQLSPEYLLFLKSIKKDEDRLLMELRIRLLTQPSMPEKSIREWTHLIKEALENQVNLDEMVKQIVDDYHNNWNKLVKELCEMEGVFSIYNNLNDKIIHEINRVFLKYLVNDKAYNDPCVFFLYGIMINDVKMVKEAKERGVDESVTDNEIKQKYHTEYDEFLEINCMEFVSFLINEKSCKDPDVLYLYGVKKPDEELKNRAKTEGADENITFSVIINRYKDDYLEFMTSI